MARPLGFRRRRPLLPFLFLVLPAGFAVSFMLWFSFALSPLQKQYLPTYIALTFSGGVTEEAPVRFPVEWIWKTGLKHKAELAFDADVVPAPNRGGLPLALSPAAQAQGWTALTRVRQVGNPRSEMAVLQENFFAGQNLSRLLVTPLCGMALLAIGYLAVRRRSGSQSRQEERHGRRTKGPILGLAKDWIPRRQARGIRFQVRGKFGLPGACFEIPRALESSHILILGDTGSGKSNAIRQILRQVEDRQESAVVYDPAGEFVQEFYSPERGDLILNPLDARCPFWNLSGELDGRGIEDAIAAAMLPEKQFESGFFTEAPRRVLAALLRKGGSVEALLGWMADPAEIERRLTGTPQAAYLDRKAGPQRAGVLASLNLIADSLELLPKRTESERWFTTADWNFQRTRWVFLTSRPAVRERVLPLHSAWLDLLILRMMEPCANPAKPVWFVLDELASLNKLPQLHTAVTENRKYGNPVVLGFQGRSQLEKRYGHDAEAMLSQPATKIFFKTSEPRAAKWISETLGEVEVERLKESRSPGFLRSRRNYALEIATKPLVMASEIAGLAPLRAYIKQENRVVPVDFAYVPKRQLQPEFIERRMTVPVVPRQEAQTKPATEPVPDAVAEEIAAESRKPAFRKKEGPPREWKPID